MMQARLAPGNGQYSPYPAQIHFGGTSDGIVLCGNAYGTENQSGDVTLKPSYAYDADAGTLITNSHLYESPPPQTLGAVYSPNAAIEILRFRTTISSGAGC
jgi:hypothetical protein